ncbi:MAG: TolB family protein, partial [Armatimonadota bacterium]
MKFVPTSRRMAALAVFLAAVAGTSLPVLGQASKRAPRGIGEYAVPMAKFPGIGDSRFIPSSVTKRSLGGDEPGKTRRQIGGTNGANVQEQVVNAFPTPTSNQVTPYTTDDEQFIYFVGNNGGTTTYQIQRFGAGAVSNPAQPGTSVPVVVSNEPGADHLFPVLNPSGNRIVFAKSTDGKALGDASKVWHLYASNVPASGTLSTTAPGATNLIPLTLGRGLRGRTFQSVGRAGWIGTNDIVFSAKLEGAGETYHLYTINTTTLTVFQITDGAANERNPVVSPDGRYVAFDSDAAPSVAGDAYAGWTSPRSETLAGDPATATAVNGSG